MACDANGLEKCTQLILMQVIAKAFKGLPNVKEYMDNILIHSKRHGVASEPCVGSFDSFATVQVLLEIV